MRLAVWLPLVASLALGVGARPLAGMLRPRTAACALTGAAALVAGCGLYCLALLAAGLLGRLPALAAAGRWSVRSLAASDPVPAVVSLLALVSLTVGAGALVAAAARRLRALARAQRVVHAHRHVPLVVLPDLEPEAYAIAGLTLGRVAVSAGMLRALDDAERAAMLAHEAAHLRGRHHLLRCVAEVAAAVDPALRRVPGLVEQACERWADEDAARRVGDRALVARALSRAALARLGHSRGARSDDEPVGGGLLNDRSAPGRSDGRRRGMRRAWAGGWDGGSVVDRVQALLVEPVPSRPTALAAMALAAALVLVATGHASQDLDQLFDHAKAALQLPLHRPPTPS